MHRLQYVLLLTTAICTIHCKKFIDEDKPEWTKKDIRDYNDADLERLFEQWEVNVLRFVERRAVTVM
jgi:hypothetical protein